MTPYRERREAGAYAPPSEPKNVIEERAETVAVEERQAQELRDEAEEGGESDSPSEEAVAYGGRRAARAPSEEQIVAKRPRGRPRKNPLPESP
jgi:hypothetical protein